MLDEGEFLVAMGKHHLMQKTVPLHRAIDFGIPSELTGCMSFSKKHVCFPELSSLIHEIGTKLKKCNTCLESLAKEDCILKSVSVYKEAQNLVTDLLPRVFGPKENITTRIHYNILKDLFGQEKPVQCDVGNHDSIIDLYVKILVRGYLLQALNFINRIISGKIVLFDVERHNSSVKEAHDIRQKMLPKKNRQGGNIATSH
ncbi:hypothetical protein QAD02_007711 [Eretmocerus hayati]|uniref:Uncharacterized protein n=1 Tax=Eretmocerus hayati TaxID=131215 RepID=A0ACC2N6V1_9HYME|nr:hypothetical protein QAD02_007711 [Eretmocerus hayati]